MTTSVTTLKLDFQTLWKNYPNNDPCINPRTGKKHGVEDIGNAVAVVGDAFIRRKALTLFRPTALHCFQKKTPKTSQVDIEIAKKRFKELVRGTK